MSTHTQVASAANGAGWRFKLGLALFATAFLLWLLLPLGGVLGLTGRAIATLTGAVFVANKVLLLLTVAVMGKAGFQQLKSRLFGMVTALAADGPVGPWRHRIGLAMFCLPIVTAWVEPYLDHLWPGLRPNLWQAQLLGDVMFVASFFVLGGAFWDKVRALFFRRARAVYPGDPA